MKEDFGTRSCRSHFHFNCACTDVRASNSFFTASLQLSSAILFVFPSLASTVKLSFVRLCHEFLRVVSNVPSSTLISLKYFLENYINNVRYANGMQLIRCVSN